MIIKRGKDYVLSPPKNINGMDKIVAWEIDNSTIQIEKTWEQGQIFARIKRFLGLPAINKETIIKAHKEGKKYVSIKLNKGGKQGIFLVEIEQWIKQAEEQEMVYHNPKSTEKFCSGYDDQYVLPHKLFIDNAKGIAEEIRKEIWAEVGTPEIEYKKLENEVINKIKGNQKTLFSSHNKNKP